MRGSAARLCPGAVSEEVFLADGTFVPLHKLASEPFLKLWEKEVFKLLLTEGKITDEIVANIRSWQHSGCSVNQSVRVEAKDTEDWRVSRNLARRLQAPALFV